MEDVRDVSARPRDPQRPLVCVDARNNEPHRAVVAPLPVAPRQSTCLERTYERNGVSTSFMCFAPLEHWRHGTVTDRRTRVDWAPCRNDRGAVHVPDAERIVVVMDNLSTHPPAAWSIAVAPAAAKRMWNKLEIHDTPKHGAWLNMAEIAVSVLARRCLDRRIPDQEALQRETTAWMERRNTAKATIEWRFTTADARIKRTKLYPTIEPVK